MHILTSQTKLTHRLILKSSKRSSTLVNPNAINYAIDQFITSRFASKSPAAKGFKQQRVIGRWINIRQFIEPNSESQVTQEQRHEVPGLKNNYSKNKIIVIIIKITNIIS